MILYELTGTENNPVYQELEISNGNRHYEFLRSIVVTCIKAERDFLSTQVIKALNYHAIACLHLGAGEFRPCPVTVGDHQPPEHYQVQALVDDMVNQVNRQWEKSDPVLLSAFVLWRLNYIHPFINGNGRTSRAACYFVLCLKSGGLLPGTTILPELIRQNREEYVKALQSVDASLAGGGPLDLTVLHEFLNRLIAEQLASAQESSEEPAA